MKIPVRLTRFGILLAVTLAQLDLLAATATGTLRGSVSNAATGNLLEGAQVEVPVLGRRVLTDSAGRFALTALPGGPH
jgi:hypothetical protein